MRHAGSYTHTTSFFTAQTTVNRREERPFSKTGKNEFKHYICISFFPTTFWRWKRKGIKDGILFPTHKSTLLTALKEGKTDTLSFFFLLESHEACKGANNHEGLLFKHRYDGIRNTLCKKHLRTNSYRVHQQLGHLRAVPTPTPGFWLSSGAARREGRGAARGAQPHHEPRPGTLRLLPSPTACRISAASVGTKRNASRLSDFGA